MLLKHPPINVVAILVKGTEPWKGQTYDKHLIAPQFYIFRDNLLRSNALLCDIFYLWHINLTYCALVLFKAQSNEDES